MNKLLTISNHKNQHYYEQQEQHISHECQELQKTIPEKMLTRKEAAEFLKVKVNTLAIWASTKRYSLPIYKVGKYIKYKLTDLQKFQEGILLS